MRTVVLIGLFALLFAVPALAAYEHEGEVDSPNFLAVHPEATGGKLDSCATCHTGGTYEKFPDSGKYVTVGSCQWCHRTYGYDGSGDLLATLNTYGLDYLSNGRSQAAVSTIKSFDSDGDGYPNVAEIEAGSYPGDAADDPTKKPAPTRVVTLDELKQMAKHAQFILMNSTKSGDYYAEYAGVTVETLLAQALAADSTEGITVYAPDGFSQNHPMDGSLATANSLYPVLGEYPVATYQYDAGAIWCDYTAPGNAGRVHGEAIVNPNGNRLILAYERNGEAMDAGVLTLDNKLDGEGPFRMVPPQVAPSVPDQASNAESQDVVWPYDSDLDHNSGFSSRTVTVIRVEPLPEGTTDADILEAGWDFVDEGKILIYGNIASDEAKLASAGGEVELAVDAGVLRDAQVGPLSAWPTAAASAPEDEKPYGVIDFAVTELTAGASVQLTMELPEHLSSDDALYAVNNAGEWTKLSWSYGSDLKTLKTTLTDGDAATDRDGIVNGRLALSTVLVSEGGDGGGCTVSPRGVFGLEWLLLAGFALLPLLRRSRG